MSRILLRGGCVLTMGATNHSSADVLIEGPIITEVGPGIRVRDAEVIDATDTVVMPGMVDAHRHSATALFRNLGVTVDTSAALAAYSAEDVYAATLLGLTSALDAGITAVADWLDGAHPDAALQAHRDSGIRSVVIAPVATAAALRGQIAEASPRQTIAVAASDDDADAWDEARRLGLRVHAHTTGEPGGLASLAGRGRLGPEVTLVHLSRASEEDLDAVASTGTAVVLTPAADMAAGLPMPPIQGLIDRGIRPGLGVDREHLAPGDAFAQMRAVISVQHATVFDRKLAGKAGLPRLLTTREVIRYGTVDGARAAGLPATVGTIEPGQRADLVVLRTDRPNVHPVNDPIGAVVWGMDTSNIDLVVVDGEVRKRHGALVGEIDRVRRLAGEAHGRVMAAGTLSGAGR